MNALLDGIALGAAMSVTPGPLLALTVTTALTSGARAAVAVAAAPLVTDAPVIAISLVAAGALSDRLLSLLTLAGAGVLLWLAADAWRGARAMAESGPERPVPRALWRGALVNVVSPHPWLFWATVGAPLVVRAWRESPPHALAFVGGFYVLLIGGKAAVAVAVARSRRRLRPRQVLVLTRAGAILLVVTAITLATAA